MTATFAEGRWMAVCVRCRTSYRTWDGWAWACPECGLDAQAEALVEVARVVLAALDPLPPILLCPHDGCALLPGEACPACQVTEKDRRSKAERLLTYSDTEPDPKRPVAWRHRRGIQVPVYDQSEVA